MDKNTQVEALLISAVSADPFSTLLLNPFTGISYWSYRGTELQGGTSGVVEPLGEDPKHIFFGISNKPIIYCSLLISKSSSANTRSILPNPVKHLVSHPSGSFLFGSIGTKIYTWMVITGHLVSVTDDAFQEVSALKISTCGTYLFVGFENGCIKVYLCSDLTSERLCDIEESKAVSTINVHSLAVTDIYITNGSNPRVLSVALDHSIVLSMLCADRPLLKISTDHPLTACCMDPAETKIFVGTKSGKICVIDLYRQFRKREEILISITDNGSQTAANNGLEVFEHHSDEVCKVCVNFDATMLASGDKTGSYCIWDISNGQCLKASSLKGRISVLQFTKYWPALKNAQKGVLTTEKSSSSKRNTNNLRLPQLKMERMTHGETAQSIKVFKETTRNTDFASEIDKLLMTNLDDLVDAIPNDVVPSLLDRSGSKVGEKRPRIEVNGHVECDDDVLEDSEISVINGSPADKEVSELSVVKAVERIKALEKELKRVTMINNELYQFAADIALEK